ncbi:hypothetical protein ACFW3D_33845 [Streptomyces sp. NPDC058864]
MTAPSGRSGAGTTDPDRGAHGCLSDALASDAERHRETTRLL